MGRSVSGIVIKDVVPAQKKVRSARVVEQCWWAAVRVQVSPSSVPLSGSLSFSASGLSFSLNQSEVFALFTVVEEDVLVSTVDDVDGAPAPLECKFVALSARSAKLKGKRRASPEEEMSELFVEKPLFIKEVHEEIHSICRLLNWRTQELEHLTESELRAHLVSAQNHLAIVSAHTGPFSYTPRECPQEEARLLPVWSPVNRLTVDFQCGCCEASGPFVSGSANYSTTNIVEEEDDDEDFEMQLTLAISLSLGEASSEVVGSASLSPVPTFDSASSDNEEAIVSTDDSTSSTTEVSSARPLKKSKSKEALKKLNKVSRCLLLSFDSRPRADIFAPSSVSSSRT